MHCALTVLLCTNMLMFYRQAERMAKLEALKTSLGSWLKSSVAIIGEIDAAKKSDQK